jgi:predicted secreted protein
MSLVQGRNVLLKVFKTDGYYSIACNSSCTLNMAIDELETTFLGSGAQKTYIPNRVSQSLQGSGPIYLADSLTAADIRNYAMNRSLIQWSFELTDNDANTVSYTGTGFFTSVDITGDVSNAALCDYQIRVTGPVNASGGVPGSSLDDTAVFVYTATGGEISFSDADLIGVTVIDVERNGIGLIVKTTSPSVNEVQFASGTGTLTFNYALGAGEYIQVIYQP